MKTNKAEMSYVKKLNEYIDKYGDTLDTDFIDLMISIELSDTAYEHHSNSLYKFNFFIIGLQWLSVVVNIIAIFLGVHISYLICIFSFILLGIVLVSIHIHNVSWQQAKNRNECIKRLVTCLRNNTKKEIIKDLENKYNMTFEV